MGISACMITYNEQEMLPLSLQFLNSMPSVKEIIVVDSYSTDKTDQVAAAFDFTKRAGLEFKYVKNHFETFAQQRNFGLELATQDWILLIDADETYTRHLHDMWTTVTQNSKISAIRIPTLTMIRDRRHYLHNPNHDPHIRLWKRGFARFERDVHEHLVDQTGRLLHNAWQADIFECHQGKWGNVWMKHHQLLKSEAALLHKGDRWDSLGMIEKSAQNGIPIYKQFWYEGKINNEAGKGHPIIPLPEDFWDITTAGY